MSRIGKSVAVTGVVGVFGAIGVLSTDLGRPQQPTRRDMAGPVFRDLVEVRTECKGRIIAHFDAARRLAEGILDDEVMMGAFETMRGSSRPLSPREDSGRRRDSGPDEPRVA